MTKHKKVFNISDENQDIIDKYLEYKTNQKPIIRPRNLISPLRTLSDYLKETKLTNATAEDLMYFFNPKNKIINLDSRNYTFQQIKLFYRWVDKLDRYTMSPRLKWYEPVTNKAKRRYIDPKKREKHFITKNDYAKMFKYSNDAYGQDSALWETFHLSGVRPEEMPHLKIGDIVSSDDGNYAVEIREGYSKTVPRTIPLPERPDHLIRWLGNHPDKKNKKSPLWISYKNNNIKAIDRDVMYKRFIILKVKSGIKKTLQLKSFRKNRATIMFNQPKKYSDTHIALFFGWTPKTVAQRRSDYELSNYDDLKKLVWSKPKESISYDTILNENKKLKESKTFLETKDIVTKKEYEKTINDYDERLNKMEYNFNQKFNPNNPELKQNLDKSKEYIKQNYTVSEKDLKYLDQHGEEEIKKTINNLTKDAQQKNISLFEYVNELMEKDEFLTYYDKTKKDAIHKLKTK